MRFNQIDYLLFKIFFVYCLAVATHKYVISFCVGLELYNAETPMKLYSAYMLVYALMSPLGIGIGIAVTTTVEDNTTAYMVAVGVLQGNPKNNKMLGHTYNTQIIIFCVCVHSQYHNI